MLGSKAPNYDAYGLFRALHSHNPPNYSQSSLVFFKFMESYQKTDRIMSFGTGKPQKEWNINV